jgi:hypothetical protein
LVSLERPAWPVSVAKQNQLSSGHPRALPLADALACVVIGSMRVA